MQKGEWWQNNHDVHGVKVDGPIVAGDFFSVTFVIVRRRDGDNRI